ncbi:DUF485 domain-containing protein [Paenalcaligenes niemegkensis]|uniref:DUF485 domain-containing protein n=1 Tax=Paenalcaligenes niemegkensis TaxID=2895469 RepID=UPI001EE949FE|nr:DUF485 domain-containing protein [Paenalcaligenes niemegkensis]MCQ9616967.1 DUF485 domain-containing protein [Paenalcaligenes niemegkensis]
MTSPNDVVSAVTKHPAYQELLRKRNRMSLTFFGLTVVIYAGFILTLAFDPELFSRPVGNMTMTIGVLSAILVLVSAVILVSTYVYISNKVYDPLLAKIVRDVA